MDVDAGDRQFCHGRFTIAAANLLLMVQAIEQTLDHGHGGTLSRRIRIATAARGVSPVNESALF